MAGLFAILLAVALGCALVLRFANLTSLQPRWAAALVIFGSGTALRYRANVHPVFRGAAADSRIAKSRDVDGNRHPRLGFLRSVPPLQFGRSHRTPSRFPWNPLMAALILGWRW